jgi:ABC-type phosphate transport system permease subunit
MKQLSDIEFGQLKGFGPLGTNVGTGFDIFTKFISNAIALLTVVAIIWFIFSFITGAISIISAGGDKQALESAKKKIWNSIIGLVVTIAAIFVIRLIGFLIGIPNILDIGKLLGQ